MGNAKRRGIGKPIDEGRTAVVFGLSVPPATAGELTWIAPRAGTIERMEVRIYAGAELSLQIVPEVVPLQGFPIPLLEYPAGGKQFLDGDDDEIEFKIGVPVLVDEIVRIRYNNTNADPLLGNYDFRVVMEIDYLGEQFRVGGGLNG